MRASLCLVALLLGSLPMTASRADETAPAVQLADGPGRGALEKTCLGCHPANRIVAQRRDADQWQALLAKMIEQGAMATDEDLQSIQDYLVRNYGVPASEPVGP